MVSPGIRIRNRLEARGAERREDVAAAQDAVAAHVQEPEGDAQALLGAGGDLTKDSQIR